MNAMRDADIKAIVAETLAEQQRLHHNDIDAVVLRTIAAILTSFGIEAEDRKEWMAKPHISHGMKTRTIITMKSGAAMLAAVNRIIAANSPAMPKIRSERQYWARVDAAAGAEQEFEKVSHGTMHVEHAGRPGPRTLRRTQRLSVQGEVDDSARPSLVQSGSAEPFQIVLAVDVLPHWQISSDPGERDIGLRAS
jgi:hypothetical protein